MIHNDHPAHIEPWKVYTIAIALLGLVLAIRFGFEGLVAIVTFLLAMCVIIAITLALAFVLGWYVLVLWTVIKKVFHENS